jgi:drug/metabolite transporter (DMT)-like permease
MTSNANSPSIKATIIGQLALFIWAMSVCGIVVLKDIPAFEILSVLFFSGLIASSVMNTIYGNWKVVTTHPKYVLLAGIVGIIGNDIFYIFAFKYAPAAHVDLIALSWPMIVLILASIFLNESIKFHHIFACIIAFLGIYTLLVAESGIGVFDEEYLFGYLCALTSAILWAIYVIISRKYIKCTPELFAVYCGIGSAFAISMHFIFEVTVIPTSNQLVILIFMGITTHSIAYYGWDFAIKKGHFKLLNILSYGNPIVSVMGLVFFGFAELTDELFIAMIMVFIAGIISGWKIDKKPKLVLQSKGPKS